MNLGYFILKDSAQLSFANSETLAFFDHTRESVYGYPGGTIRRNDLIVYICENTRHMTAFAAASRKVFGEIDLRAANAEHTELLVLIGRFENSDARPVVKRWNADLLPGDSVLADTIFDGVRVFIAGDVKNRVFSVGIGTQKLNFVLTETCPDMLILRGAEGISYFTPSLRRHAEDSAQGEHSATQSMSKDDARSEHFPSHSMSEDSVQTEHFPPYSMSEDGVRGEHSATQSIPKDDAWSAYSAMHPMSGEILAGAAYPGYVNQDLPWPPRIEHVFPTEVVAAIEHLNKIHVANTTDSSGASDFGSRRLDSSGASDFDGQRLDSSDASDFDGQRLDSSDASDFGDRCLEIFDLAGRAVFLRRFPGFGGEDGRTAYLIGAQAQVVAALSDFNDVYRRLEREGTDVRGADRLATRFRLWGNDAVVEKTRYLLDKICDKNVAVLLTGESGTGKTFLAKEIHNNSRRSSAPFINVNCAAIPYNLLESELFGYEEGAFTGARKQGKAGHFEMADGGTLFLDEITEIPITLQGKLLEVIQDNSFYRVGGTKKITVNVRLIMATNKDVGRLVEEGRFRNDLYYRINVFPIALPPLRERITSFYTILMDILPDICSRLEMGPLLLSDDSVQKLKSYSWPGNIRELENVLEKAAILSDGTMIRAEDIVLQRRNGATAFDLKSRVDAAERQMIVNALRIFEGNRILTARHLNIGRTSLFDKMKKYRIDDSEIGGFHGDIE